MLVDTHCHLDAAEFDAIVMRWRRGASAGVGLIVVPSVERANFGAVASVCREHAAAARPMAFTRAICRTRCPERNRCASSPLAVGRNRS
jgi:Tat protein secretion system quality control protein TatD with DNase activity